MVKRCGCVGDECTCAIFPGADIEIEGKGDTLSPHVVHSYAVARIAGRERPGGQVTVTGAGKQADPFVLSMTIDSSVNVAPKRVLAFTSPGSYTIDRAGAGWSDVTLVRVTLMGGGQAGQAGQAYAGTSGSILPAYGGAGGAGGGITVRILSLPATCTRFVINVGQGGVGQRHNNPSSQMAPPGQDGGDSVLRFLNASSVLLSDVVARGGKGGAGGLGVQFGQPSPGAGVATDTWPVNSGAAGGAGATLIAQTAPGGGVGVTQEAEKAGGRHIAYDGKAAPTLGRGGDGGRGGTLNATPFTFSGGNPGVDGYGFGAGGGGGGAGGTSKNPSDTTAGGGKGGNGASGFVLIEEL